MELKDLNNAWLNPKGVLVNKSEEFWGDSVGWHENLACCILRDIWGLKSQLDAFNRVHDESYGHYAYEELQDLGWIRLHGFGGLAPKWILPHGKKLTKAQEETILDWCNANGIKYDECFAK